MNLSKRIFLVFLISLTCVGCDQSTKTLAGLYLPKDRMDSYFYDMVRIGYTENIGGFLSLGENLPDKVRFLLLTVFTGVFLFGLLAYLIAKQRQPFLVFSGLCLFFAGGISNFYDRATNNGAVVDFLNIGVGSLRTGIFNVADMALMLGIGLIFFSHYHFRGRSDDF